MSDVSGQSRPPRLFARFREFIRTESAGGVLLLIATVAAMIWANSPLADGYHAIWSSHLAIGIPRTPYMLNLDLHHWINDGLMVLFFFMIGLEIKRELLVGELSYLKQAMLPIAGAVGGMVVPAAIYAFVNAGTPAAHGWGIPMATDIAFALAIIALAGPRVPLGLKVFLVALAIVDDLGAILVIALFYSENLNLTALLVAAGGLGLAAVFNWRGVGRALPYALVGVVIWLAVLLSGVHATIAGVLLALAIPARARIDLHDFYALVKRRLARLETSINAAAGEQEIPTGARRLTHAQTDTIYDLERACKGVQPPLDRLEHAMLPWVSFAIVPLFALANAGVTLPERVVEELLGPVSLGVILGLVLGKQIGVTAFVWLAVKLRIAELPSGVTWAQVYGAALICGVGFTMSLFIGHLAFGSPSTELDSAKLGILLASVVSGALGFAVLRRATRRRPSVPLSDGSAQAA